MWIAFERPLCGADAKNLVRREIYYRIAPPDPKSGALKSDLSQVQWVEVRQIAIGSLEVFRFACRTGLNFAGLAFILSSSTAPFYT